MSEVSSLVLLGFVDQPIKDLSEIDWVTNKIGGDPYFPDTIDKQDLGAFIRDQAVCPNCSSHSCSLVCQISCSVDENPAQRVIYVFACRQDGCNYFTAVRLLQQSSPDLRPESKSTQSHHQLWDTDSSNWSDSDDERFTISSKSDQLSVDSSDIGVQCLRLKSQSIHLNSDGFQPFYIYVESLNDLKYAKSCSLKKSKLVDENQLNESNEDGEKYENPEVDAIFSNDYVSYKFYKSLRDFPKQIIRYSWQGKPLLNKSDLDIRSEECPNCGSVRDFEFQLMPGLISQLKNLSPTSSNLDFGTVLIFCCANNCDNRALNVEKCVFLEEIDTSVVNGFVSSRS